MDNVMKRLLAALLAMSVCLSAVAFAAADGDTEEAQVQNDEIVEQECDPEPETPSVPEAKETEAPKAEQPKPEAPKAEEPKGEAPKEEPTPEEPEQEEPTDEEPETTPDVPQEPVPDEEPTQTPDVPQEPTPAPQLPDDEAEAPAFKAKVRIKLVGDQETVAIGDRVTLRAVVEDANADYTVQWQYFDEKADVEKGENPWVAFAEGEKYTFVVDEENVALTYRVVVNGTVTSKKFTLANALEPDEDVQDPVDAVDGETEATPSEPSREEEETAGSDTEVTDGQEGPSTPAADAKGQNADRSVSITADWGEGELHFGDAATLTAVLSGYDGAAYTLQWQTSKDGAEWADVEDATETSYVMTVTEDNYRDFWRVIVTVAADEE